MESTDDRVRPGSESISKHHGGDAREVWYTLFVYENSEFHAEAELVQIWTQAEYA